MRVPVHDQPATREAGPQALRPAGSRAGVVYEPDANAFRLDDQLLRQSVPDRGLVHVSVHRLQRRQGAQLLEHIERREVADVQDQVGGSEKSQASVRKPALAARQVRVADERDQRTPSRKRPFV